MEQSIISDYLIRNYVCIILEETIRKSTIFFFFWIIQSRNISIFEKSLQTYLKQ